MMKRVLYSELYRAFYSYGFLLSLALGLIIVIVHIIKSVVPTLEFVNDIFLYPDKAGNFPHTVFNKWLGGELTGLYSHLYFLFIPLLAVLPYGDSYFMDRKTGYTKNILIRVKSSSYHSAKYIAVFLSGGAAVVIPLLVNLGISALLIPSVLPEVSTHTHAITAVSMWSALYYSHPYLYLAGYFGIIFLFSGLWATICLPISFVGGNRFLVLLFPFLLYVFINSAADFFGFSALSPLHFLQPSQSVVPANFVVILIETILLAAITFGIFTIKGPHDDTF